MASAENKSRVKEGKKKVLSIIEHLLEHTIEESELIDCCKYLSKNDYEDVNIERSLVKFCGYPLCNNQLGPVPKQVYKISLREHKVYDLSERKLFCDNICYKSSLFLKQQLEEEPFWMKNDAQFSQIKTVQIYKKKIGLKGKEVRLKEYLTDEEIPKTIQKKLTIKLKSNQLTNPYLKEDNIHQLKDSIKNLTIIEKNISKD